MAKFKTKLEPTDYARPDPVIRCCVPGCICSGTMTESTRHADLRDVRMFCRFHWRDRNDPQMCAQITDDLRRNPPSPREYWIDALARERMQ